MHPSSRYFPHLWFVELAQHCLDLPRGLLQNRSRDLFFRKLTEHHYEGMTPFPWTNTFTSAAHNVCVCDFYARSRVWNRSLLERYIQRIYAYYISRRYDTNSFQNGDNMPCILQCTMRANVRTLHDIHRRYHFFVKCAALQNLRNKLQRELTLAWVLVRDFVLKINKMCLECFYPNDVIAYNKNN